MIRTLRHRVREMQILLRVSRLAPLGNAVSDSECPDSANDLHNFVYIEARRAHEPLPEADRAVHRPEPRPGQ